MKRKQQSLSQCRWQTNKVKTKTENENRLRFPAGRFACVYAASEETEKSTIRLSPGDLVAVQPEDGLQHKVGQAQAVDDLLSLQSLLVVDLNVENASIQFGQLPAQIEDLLVRRQLTHGRALTLGQHRGVQIALLLLLQVLLHQLRAFASATRCKLSTKKQRKRVTNFALRRRLNLRQSSDRPWLKYKIYNKY